MCLNKNKKVEIKNGGNILEPNLKNLNGLIFKSKLKN